ncbi:hypothetical protein JQC67_12360 [Aurantibacter crassamenti]|uniref:hypothetical protein n=1 Tax=Aurantibacter crassamenti TaxID=1837375 RepID=UPI0019396283|nr:hypothetical protein [Aurantibacter crassamenti]MBM1106935.1 hypothetical protein [Aurantibacter crassamenti]
MRFIVYVLCVFTFFITSSCDDNEIEKNETNRNEIEGNENVGNENEGDETEDSMALTKDEYIESILVSLNNNSNLEVRDVSSFETDHDLIAFPDRDPIIDENGILNLGLGYVNNGSQVNGIGFSIGDEQNAYVLFPTLEVGDPLNTLSIDLELGLDNCEFIRDLCDIIPIRFFAIKADGTVSVSFTDHIKFSCTECPFAYKSTAWGNFFYDQLEYGGVNELLSFAISGQQEFLTSQSIEYIDWQAIGMPKFQIYPGTEISEINNFNSIQCYEQSDYHVIRIKKGNVLVLFYAQIGSLNHNNYLGNEEDYELTSAGTSVGSLIKGTTVMLYELDKPPGSNWWLLYGENQNDWVGEFTWESAEEFILDPKPYHDPFRAKHYLRFEAYLTEHRPFLKPRTYTNFLGSEVEFKRKGSLYINAFLTCRHM